MTVLNDATTAQYTHTLTVTRRLEGLYTCTVANNKPSEDSATYIVRGILGTLLVCICKSIYTGTIILLTNFNVIYLTVILSNLVYTHINLISNKRCSRHYKGVV